MVVEMDVETRLHGLLRPYRELAEDWNIDIAEDLVDYVRQELESFEEASAVNFAQAALIVQNSTLVYTKKVDALYDLIFKAFESLFSNLGESGGNALTKFERKARAVAKKAATAESSRAENGDEDDLSAFQENDFYESDEDGEEFDDFLPYPVLEAFEFEPLNQPKMQSSVAVDNTIPLVHFELKRTRAYNALAMTFSSQIDVRTGAIMLDSDSSDKRIMPEVDVNVTVDMDGPIVQQQQQAQQEPDESQAAQQEGMMFEDDDASHGGGDYYNDDGYHGGDSENVTSEIQQSKKSIESRWDDWLDPDVPCPLRKDKPFKKGRCYSNPVDDSATSLNLGVHDDVSSDRRSLLAIISDPFQKRRALPRNVLLMNLVFPEFEQFKKAFDKSLKKQGRLPASEVEQGYMYDEGDGTEDEYDEHFEQDAPYFGGNDQPVPISSENDSTGNFSLVESAFDQPPETYADVVRDHVARFLESARNWASESKLSLRVRGWHDYLEPILSEQESRPAFDLREYETTLVDSLEGTTTEVPFERILGSAEVLKQPSEKEASAVTLPRWQVCRAFLTTLELANQGTIEIDDSLGVKCESEAQFDSKVEEGFRIRFVKPLKQRFVNKKSVAGARGKKAPRISEPVDPEETENMPLPLSTH